MTDLPAPAPLTASGLIAAGWKGAARAARPALPWLALFALVGGFYGAALALEGGLWAPLIAAILAFLAGIELSRRLYGALMPGAAARFLPLAHASLAVYAAFLFIGFFVVFFLMILPGILMQQAGQYQLDKDTDPAIAQEAFLAMLATPYGAVFILACLAGAALLGWFALRLTLYGAATAARGEAQVFRTWGLTRGHVRVLALASLATHLAPFLAGAAVNGALHRLLPETPLGLGIGAAAGILLMAPFLLAGHAMAAAAWAALKPAAAPPGTGD